MPVWVQKHQCTSWDVKYGPGNAIDTEVAAANSAQGVLVCKELASSDKIVTVS